MLEMERQWKVFSARCLFSPLGRKLPENQSKFGSEKIFIDKLYDYF